MDEPLRLQIDVDRPSNLVLHHLCSTASRKRLGIRWVHELVVPKFELAFELLRRLVVENVWVEGSNPAVKVGWIDPDVEGCYCNSVWRGTSCSMAVRDTLLDENLEVQKIERDRLATCERLHHSSRVSDTSAT